MDITEVSILHHIAIVLLLLWILASFGWSNTLLYFVSLLYLFAVNQHYTVRLRRKLQYEERKYANQRRLLSDSESVRWLNHAAEKVWPICMEQVASQQFLLPIIPWFLEKYKPWTVSKAVVEHLYLGSNPPMFTEIRVLGESTDDDHLVLELGLSFLSAKDMSAILSVQLRKSLGLGLWTNMHVTGMHVEGKVLVGVKFLRKWPYIGRLRVCFAEVPYFQMTVKPIINHGIDVTELPGIAGWMDNLLAVAFEQTLVEPNMLVIDVEKFASTPTESWFSVYEKPPIAYVKLEIIEAADMKPSDLNGLADPYVRGHLGTFKLRTKTHKKTLSPKWFEEFNIPISSWETPNTLFLEVRDKDHIFDDMLGECSVNISDLRGGQRHDKWLTLRNIKMGRLHLAVSVYEDEAELSKLSEGTTPNQNTNAQNNTTDLSLEENQHMAGEFEPINIEGQDKTGVWVHRPGKDVFQTWETRKGRSRRVAETELQPEVTNEGIENLGSEESATACSEANMEGKNFRRRAAIGRGLQKIGSLFQRSPKKQTWREEDQVIPTPRPNIKALNKKGTAVRIILDDSFIADSGDQKEEIQNISAGKDAVDSPGKKNSSKKIMEGEEVGKPSLNMKGVLKRKGSSRSNPDQTLEREGSWKEVQSAGEGPRKDVAPSYHESMENKEIDIPVVGESVTEKMKLQSMNGKENLIR